MKIQTILNNVVIATGSVNGKIETSDIYSAISEKLKEEDSKRLFSTTTPRFNILAVVPTSYRRITPLEGDKQIIEKFQVIFEIIED